MELVLRMCLSIGMVMYLGYQAKLDSESGYVDSTLNFVAVYLSSALSLSIGFLYSVPLEAILDASLLLLGLFIVTRQTSKGPIMQVGDAKAIWTVYLSGTAIFSFASSFYITCITVILASVLYIVWIKISKKVSSRGPYFPFLFLGYGISSVVYWIFYLLIFTDLV